jgi:hypothetical protein
VGTAFGGFTVHLSLAGDSFATQNAPPLVPLVRLLSPVLSFCFNQKVDADQSSETACPCIAINQESATGHTPINCHIGKLSIF